MNDSAVKLVCGSDPENPLLSQVAEAQAESYSVSAIVNGPNSLHVIHDDNQYTYFESGMLNLIISSQALEKNGSVTLNIKNRPVKLTDVKCN